MGGITYQDEDYKIIATKHDFVLRNRKGKYKNHGHFRKLKTCYLMMRLINDEEIPRSKYLQDAALRISTDEKYIEKILNRQNKLKNKEFYYNINKGRQ